jgi:HNH endonuclease
MSNLPAYKQDPRAILRWRSCVRCRQRFAVARKYPQQRFCSRRCGFLTMNPPDHNARVARATIRERADRLRGRGEGKAYPKLYGRHAHRVIAERKLGRKLRAGEVVHHKDGNHLNYSPRNIEVLPSQAEHARRHMLEYWAKKRAAIR